MTKLYIIVKYAEMYLGGKAPISVSIADTYTVRELGIPRGPYTSKEEAESYLPKLNDYNPTVGYGVVELSGLE